MSRVRLRNESEPYYNMVYTQQQPSGTSQGVERE